MFNRGLPKINISCNAWLNVENLDLFWKIMLLQRDDNAIS